MFASCEPNAINEEKLFLNEQQVQDLIQDGKLYTLHEFVDSFMTEKGNYLSDTTLYRTRGNNESVNPGIHLFAIDTLPSYGEGIYIRGRVTTEKTKGGRINIVITEIPYTMIGAGIGSKLLLPSVTLLNLSRASIAF